MLAASFSRAANNIQMIYGGGEIQAYYVNNGHRRDQGGLVTNLNQTSSPAKQSSTRIRPCRQ